MIGSVAQGLRARTLDSVYLALNASTAIYQRHDGETA